MADGSGDLVFTVHHETLDAGDPRWEGDVQALLADLEEQVGKVGRRIEAVPGKKGDLVALVLALGTSGLVQVFKQ